MSRTHETRRAAAPVLALTVALSGTLAGSAHAQAAAPPPQVPAGRSTTLTECVAIALSQNPDALNSDSEVEGAEAERAGVRGAFGPKVHADASLLQYNSPFSIGFGGSQFTVRNAQTFTASITVTQPLSGLFAIYDLYKIQDLGVDVAAIERVATRKEVALHTIQAYYALLEGLRLSSVAEDSVAQLEAQEKQAKSQFTNGVIGKNDLLRAGLALAGARQRAIQVRGQVQIGRGQLATTMGQSPDEAIEPVPFSGEPPPPDEPTLEVAEQHALAQRVELRALDFRIEQARKGLRFAKQKLGPTINAVGNYTNFEGSQFQQQNAVFVGLAASWDVWDWGTTTSGITKADAKLQQAIIARKKLADAIQSEARQAYVGAETARQALIVARTAVSQAEENYRIVTKKFDASAATSFDVVDAEALLTQTRGQVETALYDSLIAHAALQRATGAALPGE